MIGALAKRAGSNVQTVRYYEKIGVMPPAQRAANNRRIYDHKHLERLTFVRHCRELGFSLDDVRNLLGLVDQPDRPCDEIDTIARNHLEDVDTKIAALKIMRTELQRMISECAGERVSNCNIVKVLADHT